MSRYKVTDMETGEEIKYVLLPIPTEMPVLILDISGKKAKKLPQCPICGASSVKSVLFVQTHWKSLCCRVCGFSGSAGPYEEAAIDNFQMIQKKESIPEIDLYRIFRTPHVFPYTIFEKDGKRVDILSPTCVNSGWVAAFLIGEETEWDGERVEPCECGGCKVRVWIEMPRKRPWEYIVTETEFKKLITTGDF